MVLGPLAKSFILSLSNPPYARDHKWFPALSYLVIKKSSSPTAIISVSEKTPEPSKHPAAIRSPLFVLSNFLPSILSLPIPILTHSKVCPNTGTVRSAKKSGIILIMMVFSIFNCTNLLNS